jgi:hypothetical protein
MTSAYSFDELLEFLDHAGDRGLMPAATAQALAVASRNVMGVLSDQEKQDLHAADLDAIIKRFTNKRAKDFTPASLKEYGRRVHRAFNLFLEWRSDPANFSVKTRGTGAGRKRERTPESNETADSSGGHQQGPRAGTFNSSVPIRPGVVVTLANVPLDLSKSEAERIAAFVRMLAVGESGV